MDSLTAADIMARSEATLDPETDIYRALKRLHNVEAEPRELVAEEGVPASWLSSHS